MSPPRATRPSTANAAARVTRAFLFSDLRGSTAAAELLSAVNVASRLASKAEAGEVLASDVLELDELLASRGPA